jgi:putative tricarboxylic transport membrane protein
MDAELFTQVIVNLLSLQTIIAIALGVVGGIIIGALPGLSATMGVALLIPVTFGMEPVAGLAMLAAIYTSAVYGGSMSAILIHTPGSPASAATALDGYQMTVKGQGAKAIGISTISSMIGGFISGIALLFLAPPLSTISLKFGPAEYFLLAVFGLTIIGSLAAGSVIKGLAAGTLGLLVGTIGVDILTGYPRFTFGITSLQSGISLVPALIGLFALSQVLILAENGEGGESRITGALQGRVLPSFREFKSIFVTIIRSSGLGVLVGILPGAGGDVGSWVALNEAKRFSRNKEKFGTGDIEGVAAPEAANNAVTGGALIPLLVLGIPGSATTAVLLGGILIQGLRPGRELFTTQANITYALIIGFLLANILMGVIGLLGAKFLFVRAASAPQNILAPIIVGLSVVGAYAINNNIFDVWVMVAFGLIGYFLRKTGFPPAPVVLGLILGPIAENGLRQSFTLAQGDIISYYLSRPLSVALIVLTILSLLSPLIVRKWQRAGADSKEA